MSHEAGHSNGEELPLLAPGADDARPRIRVLPPAAVARIAAGEVIERPASAVKELVENALDAGAGAVRIDIRSGGLGLIRVGDDGCGIPAGELALACTRHATSKLAGAELERVRTLGFRGEALPSIAAVAELSLVSAADHSGLGHRLTLRGGQVAVEEPAPRPRGTTATVRRLFEQLPARLAASGAARTETAQTAQTARRLALAAPHVRFTLTADDRVLVETSGSGDLATALVEVYGRGVAGNLLPLGPVEVAGARVRGVVAGPEVTRPGRGQVNLVVNGRWVQPRGLLALVEAAYRPVLPRGRHPVLALALETPPDRVDLNIHPAKLEVRLLEERAVGTALGGLVRDALGARPVELRRAFATGLEALRDPLSLGEDRGGYGESPEDKEPPIVTPHLPPLALVGQVRARLLLLEGPEGLYLVDQHRAHERVLYERLVAAHGAAAPEPVALPEPLAIELGAAQAARLAGRLGALSELGWVLEPFGGRTFLVRAAPELPGVLPGAGAGALEGLGEPGELAEGLAALADEPAGEGEAWLERLLVGLSCRTAVRRGRALERPAMRALVEALGHTAAPAVCPHGSPLLMRVSADLLEREFRWR